MNIFKFLIPIYNYKIYSNIDPENILAILNLQTDRDMALVYMPEDTRPWQGKIEANRFKIRNVISTFSHGRSYSPVVSLGRLKKVPGGTRIEVWQRYSVMHIAMICALLSAGTIIFWKELNNIYGYLPVISFWLMFSFIFPYFSGSQERALRALISAG